MKTKKSIAILFSLIILLVLFANGWGQENCDLRNNPKTGEIEIYIDVVMKSYFMPIEVIDSKGRIWKYSEDRLTQWCNVDSLYNIHGEIFKYAWGVISLQNIINMRKYFELFMLEYQGKNGKGKKSN